MGLGPSIVSLFLTVSRHVTCAYSEKALEMMGQGPSYGSLAAPSRYAPLHVEFPLHSVGVAAKM
jgi:hypothetical protein